MEPDTRDGEASVESEFATTLRYLDLYLRQKTDLFLQNYVFEPVDILGKKAMQLAIVIALLAAGTLILVAGVILLIAEVMPLYAALLLAGVVAFLAAGIIVYFFFSKKAVLETPTALEMVNRGRT